MPSRLVRRRPSPSPITSRPWFWSRRGIARSIRSARSSFPKSRSEHPREDTHMMQAGIFTGYFPYGLKETAAKIRGLGFNTVQLDLHFKDLALSAGEISKDKAR